MSQRSLRLAVLASFAALAVPVAAYAQTGTFFVPAKILSKGTSTTPIAGKGTVTLKVYVPANAKIDVSKITVTKSTNPGDNQTAIEVAASSKYKPAFRDGKPTFSFYTFVLSFSDAGASLSDDSSSADLKKYSAMLNAGNYAGAKAGLVDYVKTNSTNPEANTLLGVAAYYTQDYAGAAAAFDKGGTIPQKFKVVAADAYTKGATQSLRDNALDAAATYAGKAIEIAPSAESYNIRGNVEISQKKYDAAAADIEKARGLYLQGKPDNAQLAKLDGNLAAAYLGAGQSEKGLAAAKDAAKLDPSLESVQYSIAQYYNDKANVALRAGNVPEAVTQFEAGAVASPSHAVSLYGNAALTLAKAAKPDWKLVKAESDKALAIDPNDARANYTAGLALASDKNPKGALPYFTKAQAAAKNGTDSELITQIDVAIKQVNGAK
jgi:tetratricopeptide (TPR) repeat protein